MLRVPVGAIEVQAGLTVVCGGTLPRSGWPSAWPLRHFRRSLLLRVPADAVEVQLGLTVVRGGALRWWG